MNETSSAAQILAATRLLAAAGSDAEFDEALARRNDLLCALGRVAAQDTHDLRAALALGDQIRVSLLRSIVQNREALDRLRSISRACHAESSVACTG